jgi:hypothetical protein
LREAYFRVAVRQATLKISAFAIAGLCQRQAMRLDASKPSDQLPQR